MKITKTKTTQIFKSKTFQYVHTCPEQTIAITTWLAIQRNIMQSIIKNCKIFTPQFFVPGNILRRHFNVFPHFSSAKTIITSFSSLDYLTSTPY